MLELPEFVGHRHDIDALAAIIEFAQAAEDATMLLDREVVRVERAGDLGKRPVVHHDDPEHELLGFDVGGHALLQGESLHGLFRESALFRHTRWLFRDRWHARLADRDYR